MTGSAGDEFEDLAQDLEKAIGWFRELGLRAEISRFGHTLKTFREFIRVRRTGTGGQDRYTHLLHAVIPILPDAYELVAIHRNLSVVVDDAFRRRAAKLLKGPERESDERGSSIIGRNIGFELLIASTLAAGGTIPDLSGPGDLSVVLGETRFNIECKRLQSTNNLDDPIADGSSQLARRVTQAPSRRCIGVLALAIGKVIHGGRKVLPAESREHGLRCLREEMQRFIDGHHDAWRRGVGGAVDLVLIYLSATCEVEQTRSLFWSQTLGHFTVNEGSPESVADLLRVLDRAMSS